MSKKKTIFAVLASTVLSLTAGSQAAFATTIPTLPSSDQLNVFGYYKEANVDWAPLAHYGQIPGVLDISTGSAVVTPADVTELSSAADSELTNAGRDAATGKTWVLFRDCSIWSIDAEGAVADFSLQTQISATSASDCFGMMIRDDSSAVISGNINIGSGSAKSVFEIDLTDVSLIAGSVKQTGFDIGGIAKDPTTGDIWVSVVWADADSGIYKYDMSTGLDSGSKIAVTDLWGMAFDSSGTLWATDWGTRGGSLDCGTYSCLSYLVPTSATPADTFGTVGEMKDADGKSFVSSGIWISTVEPEVVVEPREELADTGASDSSWVYFLLGAMAVVAGALLMSQRGARKTS
jgi:hypothetical protein